MSCSVYHWSSFAIGWVFDTESVTHTSPGQRPETRTFKF